MDPFIGRVGNFDPKMDYASKMSKQFLRRMNAGGDISSEPMFNTLAQGHAVNDRAIDMDYMTGANALISSVPGEQANLANRMRELAKEKERERYGMSLVGALGDARGQASDTLQRGFQFRQGTRFNAASEAARLQQGAGQWQTSGGWGQNLVGSAISGAAGALTGGLFSSIPKKPAGWSSLPGYRRR